MTSENKSIHSVHIEEHLYPSLLRQIPNPPDVIYTKGDLGTLSSSCVAIVGTRKPSREAEWLTVKIAHKIVSMGYTVVSGLAIGVDTQAHYGALRAGGKTVAVLGSDLSNISPVRNRRLAVDIRMNGCVVSEHESQQLAIARTLMARNRIITGLSVATIIIECRYKSGTMRSARYAQQQKRPLIVCNWETIDYMRFGNRNLLEQQNVIPLNTENFESDLEFILKGNK